MFDELRSVVRFPKTKQSVIWNIADGGITAYPISRWYSHFRGKAFVAP